MPAALIAALTRAHRDDRRGHLIYRKPARNFGSIMAVAAKCTVALVSEIAGFGESDEIPKE